MTASPPDPPSPAAPPEGFVRIGRLGRAVGLEGGIRFQPLGRGEAAVVAGLEEVFVSGHGADRVRRVRRQGKHLVLFLDGLRRVERARELVHADVYAARGELEGLEPPTPLRDDLVGAPVTLDGAPYGTVRDVLAAGPQELLVVAGPHGDDLVPLQAPYVRVGPDGVALVEPPEGLLGS